MSSTKLNKRDIFDLLMLSCIFLMAGVELSSLYFQSKYDTSAFDPGNSYMYYYMPLLYSIIILIGSLFFLCRIFIFNCCICTKVITIAYFLDQLFTTFLIFIGYNEEWYFSFIYPLWFVAIFGFFIYLIIGKILTYYKLK